MENENINGELLGSVCDSLPVGILVLNGEGRVKYRNASADRLWGGGLQDLAAYHEIKGWRASTGERIAPTDRASFRAITKGETTLNEEIVVENLSGERKTILNSAIPMRDPSGNIAGAVVVDEDITERKRAEEEALKGKELLETLFKSIDLLIAYMDSGFNFIQVNRAYAEADGKAPDFYPGKNHFDLYPDPENEIIFRRVVATGVPAYFYARPFVYPHAPERGVTYWDLTVQPVKGPEGRVTGLVLSLIDVTKHIKTDEALKESEERLRAVLDNMGNLVYMRDLEGRLVFMNKYGQAFFKKTMGELYGTTVFELFPRETAEVFDASDKLALREERTVEVEEELELKEGRRYFLTIKFPLKNAAGKTYGLCGVVTDVTVLKKTDEALKESEARLRSILDNMGNAVYLKDLNERYVYGNRRFLEFLKLNEADVYGKTIFDIYPEEMARVIHEHDSAVLMAGQRLEFEERLALAEGERFFLSIRFPLKDTRGEAYAICGVSTDITDIKKTEEALKKSEARLREAQRIGRMGAWNVDIARDRIEQTDEVARILGRSAEEVDTTGKFMEAVHPEDRGFVSASVNDALYAGKPYSIDFRIIRPDNEVRFVHSEGEVERDPSGRPLRMRGTVQDVTELKTAARRLEESERKYRGLVENSIVAVFTSTLDGQFLYVNEAMVRIYEFGSAEELKYENAVKRFKNPADRERMIGILKELGRVEGFEFEGITKKGNIRNILIMGRLYEGVFSGMALDITERKRMENEVRRLNAELEQRVEDRTRELKKTAEDLSSANREMETFTYSVAHDLRSPLRLIDGFSMVLLKKHGERLDREGQDHLERIRGAVKRMGALIDDLLNLSYVLRAEVSYGTVNLSGMASAIITDMKKSDPERKAEMTVQEGLKARGDERLIRMVLENLIGNAWKYSSKREVSHIEFGSAGPLNGTGVYYVRDDGVGFRMEEAWSIFEPFHRLRSADEFPGTGVGLSTVRRIIERHGGRIWAESEPGKGSVFFFTLEKED
ncbi:MAG: PAS domain S-box protein [Deltaproteobacteria bacterium]|nr:PAS domain S-box protein [Deltaproteobacteria bacterium]